MSPARGVCIGSSLVPEVTSVKHRAVVAGLDHVDVDVYVLGLELVPDVCRLADVAAKATAQRTRKRKLATASGNRSPESSCTHAHSR
jgi:hypothetical protein